MECLFCKIVDGEIGSDKVYEDEYIYAFRDINPVAPTHILVIPKKHIDGLDKMEEDDIQLIGHIMFSIKKIAVQENLSEGYRVVTNILAHGGQSVRHLHFHLIGGKKLNVDFS